MIRKKRPYFTLVVFATLLVFILFLAWQSSVFRKQMEEARPQAQGRTLFLPLAGDLPCRGRGCPGSPYPAPAYPALGNPALKEGARLTDPPFSISIKDFSPQRYHGLHSP